MQQPPITEIDRRDTHRLIPAQYADDGASVLTRLTNDEDLLEGIFELDNATNDRLLAESDLLPGIDGRELVFGIPSYRIINAAFTHCPPGGNRFSSSERNAWYAAFEVATSQVEVSYHKRKWLEEIGWQEEEVGDYVDFLADFHAHFHDLRESSGFEDCLSGTSYAASQRLGAALIEAGSAGVVYPNVRREGGNCLACFRPVLVNNVRRGRVYRFHFQGWKRAPKITPK